jgi:hypothetical protein
MRKNRLFLSENKKRFTFLLEKIENSSYNKDLKVLLSTNSLVGKNFMYKCNRYQYKVFTNVPKRIILKWFSNLLLISSLYTSLVFYYFHQDITKKVSYYSQIKLLKFP